MKRLQDKLSLEAASVAKCWSAFHAADLNGNGEIEVNELRKLLEGLGEVLSEDDFKKVVTQILSLAPAVFAYFHACILHQPQCWIFF